MKQKAPVYRRILLKLSGEALLGKEKFGVDPEACHKIATQIQELRLLGVEVAVVIGGGNLFRGSTAVAMGMERTPADHIGMLGTLINGIVLQQALEKIGCDSRILSAVSCDVMAEPYSWKGALAHLSQGRVLLFVGGTGNPYFTTDSAATLRALEIQADLVIKATKVDGVYEKDPMKYPEAKKFTHISYREVLDRQIKVMDPMAIALCWENGLRIQVLNLFQDHALYRAVTGENIGTLVEERRKDE